MALPAQPGAPTPTPTPRPVAPSPGETSPADYLLSRLTALQACNQNETHTIAEFTTWFGKECEVVKDAEL